MKWLTELWSSASNTVRIALVVAFVVVVLAFVWLGQAGLIGGWLTGN
jgi:hypothetical protein